jgi:predicted RNase H-like HicB family nuclease
MYFRLAVEDIEPNHWVAYVLDLPGCFSSAANLEGALLKAPQAIERHADWLAARGVALETGLFPMQVLERR